MATVGRSALWASGWALGAALGVALGAYLTATSGAGAPGVVGLDTRDLVMLPALAAGGVFIVGFLGYLVVFSRRPAPQVDGDGRTGKHHEEHGGVSRGE